MTRYGHRHELSSELPHHAGDGLLRAHAEFERRCQPDALRVRRGAEQQYDAGADSRGSDTREHGAGEGKRLASRNARVRTICTAIGILHARVRGEPRGNRPARTETADTECNERGQTEAEQTKGLCRLGRSEGEAPGCQGRLLRAASQERWVLRVFRGRVRGVKSHDQAGRRGDPVSSFEYQ
jgi:hypothetical protein